MEEQKLSNFRVLAVNHIEQMQSLAEKEAQSELSRIALQVDASTRFIVFGITHGGALKEKILLNQLAKQYSVGFGVAIVPKWSVIEGGLNNFEPELHAQAVECYIKTLFENIISIYPDLLCGVICDANLGHTAGKALTPVVINYLAKHPKINSLRLFTATPKCAEAATRWARGAPNGACYKLSEEQSVGEHSTIVHCIREQYQFLENLSAPDQQSSEIVEQALTESEDSTDFMMLKLSNKLDFVLPELALSDTATEISSAFPSVDSDSLKGINFSSDAIVLPKIKSSTMFENDRTVTEDFATEIHDSCELPSINLPFHLGTGL